MMPLAFSVVLAQFLEPQLSLHSEGVKIAIRNHGLSTLMNYSLWTSGEPPPPFHDLSLCACSISSDLQHMGAITDPQRNCLNFFLPENTFCAVPLMKVVKICTVVEFYRGNQVLEPGTAPTMRIAQVR